MYYRLCNIIKIVKSSLYATANDNCTNGDESSGWGDKEYEGRVKVCDGGVWGVYVPVFGTVMRLKLYAGN